MVKKIKVKYKFVKKENKIKNLTPYKKLMKKQKTYIYFFMK